MIAVKSVNQRYGSTQILWNCSLDIKPGACNCIMGRNGVGKTTLLNCIMGLLPITTGSIEFNGVDISAQPPQYRARNGIGYVPQGRGIFADLTVEENLRLGLFCRQKTLIGNSKTIPEFVYQWFPALKELRKRRGGDLSGGQQQQLAIARALAIEPRLLILDEPNEGIQPNIVNQIAEVMITLSREHGLTLLLVEQKLNFARRVADYFHLMEKGRIVASAAMCSLNDELIKQHLAV